MLQSQYGKNSSKPVLTVSLLVSNRKDTVRKCLDSVRPLLNAIPSELIVVDTVGPENSDGSLEIAKEYTENIVHFDWRNDFAAARNAGLKRANGEWFLFIDDDEWFEDVTPIIQFFLSGEYRKYDRGWYRIRNYRNMDGMYYEENTVDRMCRITERTVFEGRVHECLMPQGTNIFQFECYVHHYGYAYASQEEKEKHTARNVTLLEMEVQEKPDDLRMCSQLIWEYCIIGELEKADELCQKLISRYSHKLADPFAQYPAVMHIRILGEQNKWSEVVSEYGKLCESVSRAEVANLVCMGECISALVELKAYEEVISFVHKWLKLRADTEMLGDKKILQMIYDYRKYLSEEYKQHIIGCGVYAMLQNENGKIFPMRFEKVNWETGAEELSEPLLELVELYGMSGKGEWFFPYAEQIVKNPQMKQFFFEDVQNLIRKYPQRKEEVSGWLDKYSGKKRTVAPEIEKLAAELKKNIRVLIAAGNLSEAKELWSGLKEIVPEDEELVELKRLM